MPLKVPCPQCGKVPPPPCDCPPLPPGPPDPVVEEAPRPAPPREPVGLRREKRRGRPVIVIEGLPEADVGEFARSLKQRCGAGGTIKGSAIEIQGDHREAIEAFLRERGFRTKRTGG